MSTRARWQTFSTTNLPAVPVGNSARFLDFSTSIPNNGIPTPVWEPYLGDSPDPDPAQSGSVGGGYYTDVVGANSSPYVQFQPYPYNYPGGYARSWLKSGAVWSANFNRLSIMTRCDTAYARRAGNGILEWGTYVRGPNHTSGNYQGDHGYHHFNPLIPAGKWIKWVLTNKPTHVVGENSNINWIPDAIVPYQGRAVQTGSTSQSSWVRLLYGDGVTPVTSYTDASTLIFSVQRDQNTPLSNDARNLRTPDYTLSNLASAGASFTVGGIFHVGSGLWRFDPPNSMWSTGVSVVSISASDPGSGVPGIQGTKIEHAVSSGATNTSPNAAAEMGSRSKYYELCTRMYFDMQQTPDFVGTWDFGDFRFFEEPNTTPEHEISNYCIYYTGARYEFEFQGLKNTNRTYEIRYRLDGQSMRANGFTGGTSGGTVTSTGDAYTSNYWTSSNMSESTNGIYVAVRVQSATDFHEVFYPFNYGPGNDGFSAQYG